MIIIKKQLATIVVTTFTVGATVLAANPFSDVSQKDWSYQSVEQLASEGIINGYPEGTFKGQCSITRYEMAQMIAKAIAHQDKANAEQKAVISKLSNEYADELNSLGVRIDYLEKNFGHVQTNGNLRLRWQHQKGTWFNGGTGGRDSKDNVFDFRARLEFDAKVADKTTVIVRLANGAVGADATEFGNNKNDSVYMDRAYIIQKIGQKLNIRAGRTSLFIGQGMAYDDMFDGIVLTAGTDKLKFTGAYGYMPVTNDDGENSPVISLAQVDGKVANINLTGYYMQLNQNNRFDGNKYDYTYGAGANRAFGYFTIGGEYAKAKLDEDVRGSANEAWTAYLSYKGTDINKIGSYGLQVNYYSVADYAPIFSSTYDNPFLYKGATSWYARAAYVPAKNIEWSVGYGFSAKTNSAEGSKKGLDDYFRMEINYYFL